MIVRISTEGQYEIDDDELPALNELDNAAASARELRRAALSGDVQAVARARPGRGWSGEDGVVGSDLIFLPPMFSSKGTGEISGGGLIPG